jgi:hypothetical protein
MVDILWIFLPCMNSHQHWFLVYDKHDGGMAYLGDDSPLNIVFGGRVLIIFPDRRVKWIDGVFIILGMEQNLLTISTLNDAGVQAGFYEKWCNMA